MASPQNLHLDPGLQIVAANYENKSFIGHEIAKYLPAEFISATFLKGRRQDSAKGTGSTLVGHDGLINEITAAFDRATYKMEPKALMEFVGSLTMTAVNSSMNSEEQAVARLMQRLMLAHEVTVRDQVFTAANFAAANQVTISTAWTNTATGDPWSDIKAGIRKLPSFGDDTYIVAVGSDSCIDTILASPSIREAVHGSLGPAPTEDELAKRLGIEKVLRSNLVYNSATDGQTPIYTRVWTSDKFGLYTVPRNPQSPTVNCFALSFSHGDGKPRVRTEYSGTRGYGGGTNVIVEYMDHAAMVIQSDAGVLFTGTGAT